MEIKNEVIEIKNIPKILYKYRVWEEPCKDKQFSRRILTDNEVYFASADQFNDPFDCAIPFKYKKEDLTEENILKKHRCMAKRDYPEIHDDELRKKSAERYKSGVFENGQYWKSVYPTIKESLNKEFGILSLTSKNDDILMWSHYSDSHRGFCVGLDRDLLKKSCYATDNIKPIKYDENNNYPELRLLDNIDIIQMICTKSIHWKYEDEYRIVKVHSSRKTFEIKNEAIVEIILGCKIEKYNKQIILNIAEEKFPNAKIFEAKINEDEYKLDIVPIN